MKRTQYSKTLKQTFLAVPAAALMLGVSQAQTTVGINFVAQYANGTTNYAAIGSGYGGYQMTGFPVTTNAFGVAQTNWANTGLMPGFSGPGTSYTTTAGTIVANFNYANMWSSDIGNSEPYPYGSGGGYQSGNGFWGNPGTVNPGNDQVTWAIEDSNGWTNTLSGLSATFPRGYVLELISASGNTGTKLTSNSHPIITDGATFTNILSFNTYTAGNTNCPGTVGLAVTPVLTNDTITMSMGSNACSLAGFILTDQPVISQPVVNLTNYNGQTLILNSGAFGIAPINYQWLFNGVPIPGATTAIYTNPLVTFTNAGSYSVMVSNPYGSASNTVALLAIIPLTMQMTNGNVIQDTKPVGTPYDGYNHGTTWLASSTDYNDSLTNYGVEQFVATNNTQITVPAYPDLNSTNGTICFWINYLIPGNLPGKGSEGAMLFDRRLVNTNGAVIVLSKSGGIEVQSTGGVSFTGNISVVDGYWHQVTVTYGQTTNDAESLYIDGALDTSAANTGTWAWPTNQEIELGLSHDPYWYAYDGQIDDFRIYNRILTADEITTVATPATSSDLIDTNALQLRFSFDNDNASFGTSLVWPYGNLVSSPVLGAGAVWTPLPGATSPFPFVTSPAVSAAFYRIMNAP